ncbi:putative ABC multidrug transporter [Stipitochalara longipes BDJ]|nr:putative ABC multidrug transporter [Stipitochalara longipes BDJ]
MPSGHLDGPFDFKLTFEQSILSILPSALFLVVSPLRITWLLRGENHARGGWLLWIKLVVASILFCLQLALVALWALPSITRTRVSLASTILALGDSCIIAVLVYTEHKRSVRPSTLLSAYLAVSTLLGLAQARSLFLQHRLGSTALAGLSIAILATKLTLLLLEEASAFESTSGPINRSVFWWINKPFIKGFQNILQVGNLGSIDGKFTSDQLLSRLSPVWIESDKFANHSLLTSILSAFKLAFLSPMLPRLCLAEFSFAQPFLVNSVVHFVGQPYNNESRGIAGGLIGATALIYVGLATMRLGVTAAREGVAITLMSTDIDGIANGIKDLHEIWANVFELGVAVYLLQRQIGSACFLAVIPAVVSSFITTWAMDGIGTARGQWNRGVQKRVSATSSMLAQIKGLKMMGLTGYMSTLIQELRITELNLSKKFRIVGPGGFTVSEAFTALSVVALVATPLANLMRSYPTFVSSLACFDRIQQFLLSEEQKDERLIGFPLSSDYKTSFSNGTPAVGNSLHPKSDGPYIEMQKAPTQKARRVNGKWKTEPILRDISISLRKSSLTMIVGSVGSSKSSLLNGILGEIPPSAGTVRVERAGLSIAYCDQTAWLRNVSIRENIVGESEFEQDYYESVIRACVLQQDISQSLEGSETLVGSGGITLSGGQKQIVALARALYSCKAIVLLDDVFSALDTATSTSVFEGILSSDGLLRENGTTVILATHAATHLSSADHIIILSKAGTIEQSGSFAELQASDSYVKDLALQARSKLAEAKESPEDTAPLTKSKASSKHAVNDDYAWKRQTGDLSLYQFYFKSVGVPLAVSFLCLAIGYIFMGRLPQVWVRVWAEHETATDRSAYAGAYIAFCLATVIFAGLSVGFFMIVVIPKSAVHQHWLLLDAVVKAPLWCFTTTDNMTLVDQALPMAFFETSFDSFDVIAGTALIASGAQYVAAMIPLCIVPLYFLQKIYLRTSRQLRHLDLEAKSPLYTHFTETLSGVVTIRAFGWKPAFLEENLRLLDFSQKPYYLLFCIQRWLGVVMDLFVAGIAIVLVAFAVEFTDTTSRGAIGLSMINIIGFNNSFSRLISSWTSLETSLGAAARLRDFLRDTPKEDTFEKLSPPLSDWPSAGAVELKDVTATYHGKSSLLLTLLRLLETPSGSLSIDNLSLSSFPRNILRLHFTTLPQDPVTLPGTVRNNIDPLSVASSDEGIILTLEKVFLWGLISGTGGLYIEFDTLGLSHGQQQLFSLARAMLNKRKVVLLDEATSSVDRQTDEAIQNVIWEEFKECRVLVVAHRLETIGDADVVVVIDQGKIAEVGAPKVLREGESVFRTLWENRHG